VPGRNLLFAAATVPRLTAGDTLVVGVHAGDHPIYPDCRPEFWEPLAQAIDAAYSVTVRTPFLYRTKAELLRAGIYHGAPVELTWSCYQGGERHCGRCGTCVERAEAFALADMPDPTDYADPHFWRTAVTTA
jgi:7-cyano-7-deazaguanine synthase